MVPINIAIATDAVGQAFLNWWEAPVGTLLAHAGKIVAVQNQQHLGENEELKFALHATSPIGDALVVISPRPALAFRGTQQNANFMGSRAFAFGPAVDVSTDWELAISNVEPKGVPNPMTAGHAILEVATQRIFYVVDYPDYANRGVVARGENQGAIVELPADGCIFLGKVDVRLKQRL